MDLRVHFREQRAEPDEIAIIRFIGQAKCFQPPRSLSSDSRPSAGLVKKNKKTGDLAQRLDVGTLQVN